MNSIHHTISAMMSIPNRLKNTILSPNSCLVNLFMCVLNLESYNHLVMLKSFIVTSGPYLVAIYYK